MKFRLNLATRIYVNTRQVRLYGGLAITLLLVLFVLLCGSYFDKKNEIDRLDQQIAAMDEKYKTESKGIPEKQYKALLTRITFANSIIEKKVYNWLSLFDRLEQVTPVGVVIISLEPDTKNQGLKMTGIARKFNDLRLFMEHLEESPYFTDIYLNNQGETRLSDKSLAISFSLSCRVSLK